MGTILMANCKKCGFLKDEIYYGGGMMNFMEVCNVPALNRKTGQLIVKNIFKKHSEDIVFYNNPSMFKGKLGKDTHQWGDIYLRRLKNHCPQCKNYSLIFSDAGCWD